jgi:hypothetical protein
MTIKEYLYEISEFKEELNKKLSLYHGLYSIKKEELKHFFSSLDGKTFKEQINDLDSAFPKIDKKELQKVWKETEDLYMIIGKIPYCTELKPRILRVYNRMKAIKKSTETIEKFKDLYYNMMNDFFRDIVDYHFSMLTYDTLMEFERINYLNCLFTELENYLFKTFKHTLMKYPNILKNKSIQIDDLEMFEDLNKELIREIVAEKTIHDLLYKDFEEILNFADNPQSELIYFSKYFQIQLGGDVEKILNYHNYVYPLEIRCQLIHNSTSHQCISFHHYGIEHLRACFVDLQYILD